MYEIVKLIVTCVVELGPEWCVRGQLGVVVCVGLVSKRPVAANLLGAVWVKAYGSPADVTA